VPILSTKRIQR